MIVRYLTALFGAATVTLGLFLFMNDASERMQVGDGTLYFKIMEFIPAPDPGRQLPEAPALPELRPAITGLKYEGSVGAPIDFGPPAVEVGKLGLESNQQNNHFDEEARDLPC